MCKKLGKKLTRSTGRNRGNKEMLINVSRETISFAV